MPKLVRAPVWGLMTAAVNPGTHENAVRQRAVPGCRLGWTPDHAIPARNGLAGPSPGLATTPLDFSTEPPTTAEESPPPEYSSTPSNVVARFSQSRWISIVKRRPQHEVGAPLIGANLSDAPATLLLPLAVRMRGEALRANSG
jgi:hypothetical protein